MTRLLTELRILVRRNIKWLIPFVAAGVQAVRPWFLGTTFTTVQWLGVAVTVLSAALVWVVPNLESGVALYAKAVVVIAVAGIGATIQVWPGGVSRPDLWTIGVAVAGALGTLGFRTTAAKGVQSGGAGRLGDTQGMPGLASAAVPPFGDINLNYLMGQPTSVHDFLRAHGVRQTESGAVVPMAGSIPD